MSFVYVGIVSVEVVLAVLCVLLWVNVTNILIKAVGLTGVCLTSTYCERQSTAFLWAPDIHSNWILQVASSSDHLFTLLSAFSPFRNFCRGLWSLWAIMSDPCR